MFYILLVLLLIISAAQWKPGSPTPHLPKRHLSRIQTPLCKPLWVERWKSSHVETFSLNPRLIPLHEKNRLCNTYQNVPANKPRTNKTSTSVYRTLSNPNTRGVHGVGRERILSSSGGILFLPPDPESTSRL